MSKRKIFDEVMEGLSARKDHRERKITLRGYKVETAPLPKVDARLIRDTRKRLGCSPAVFAGKLRINERTLEKWEQSRSKPNPQAAALVLLVRSYPDTLDRLEEVAAGKLCEQVAAVLRGRGKTPQASPATLRKRVSVFSRAATVRLFHRRKSTAAALDANTGSSDPVKSCLDPARPGVVGLGDNLIFSRHVSWQAKRCMHGAERAAGDSLQCSESR